MVSGDDAEERVDISDDFGEMIPADDDDNIERNGLNLGDQPLLPIAFQDAARLFVVLDLNCRKHEQQVVLAAPFGAKPSLLRAPAKAQRLSGEDIERFGRLDGWRGSALRDLVLNVMMFDNAYLAIDAERVDDAFRAFNRS